MGMASVNVNAFLAILFVLQPLIATSDFLPPLSPLLSPAFEKVCDKVDCGKGNCKASMNSSFFYECECDIGWKRDVLGEKDDLKFLPCIVPNCTLNKVCTPAPSPVEDKGTVNDESIFDICHWIDCGGGSCKNTSMFTYSCQCAADHFNLLNTSTFACFKACAIGADCKNVGVSTPLSPPAPTGSLPDKTVNQVENQAASNLLRNCPWLIILLSSLALVL